MSLCLSIIQAALAAKRARDLVRQKSVLRSSSLPGKLADCSSTTPEESGMYCAFFVFMGYIDLKCMIMKLSMGIHK